MKQSRIATYIDLFFCLVMLPLIIMRVPIDRWVIHHSVFAFALIIYLYLLYFIYRKSHFPQLFQQRKYGRILLIISILILLTILMTQFPPDFPRERLSEKEIRIREHLHSQTVWFFFLVVTGFSLSIELIFELFRQILSKQEIEAEKNKAELALYKAQINPHFLFNTLNTLYGLVLTKSDKTESAFIKFSDILKYMYTHTTDDTIDLQSELNYIRQYIDLQSLRLNNHTHIVFESHTDDEQLQIPPMILITFVENAFKYGTSSEKDCTIVIRITAERGVLRFESENDIMRQRQESDDPAIGIENCRKRLELLYPGRFSLDTTLDETGKKFKTKLILQLQ